MYRLDLACFSAPFQFDRATMKQAAESAGAIVTVAEDDSHGQMLGFVIVHIQEEQPDRYGYIITIDVAPNVRRSGIGARMLTQAEDQSRAAGASRVGLHVAVDNTSAIHFYERQHYVRVGFAKHFYRDAGLDALVYVKDL